MSVKLTNTLNQLKVLIFCAIAVLCTQLVSIKGDLNVGNAVVGLALIIIVSLLSLKIKEALPLQIPAFAWASLISFIITTPWSPIADFVLDMTAQISTGQIGTVILAVAGVSIGTKLDDIKKLSWKIVIIAFVVFIGTFFGSALISHLIMKLQGII